MDYTKTTETVVVDRKAFVKALGKEVVFVRSFLAGCKERNLKNKIKYANLSLAFDTETSSCEIAEDDHMAWVYLWTCSAQLPSGANITTYGRTLEDWLELGECLSNELGLNEKKRLVFYVHNLAFDFSFIYKAMKCSEAFAIRSRRPVRALAKNGIELRCSAELAKCKLEHWTKDSPFPKLTGNIDHTLIRHSDTPLSEEELRYAIHDTAGLAWRIEKMLFDEPYPNGEKRRIADVPHTSTGFPREKITLAFQGNFSNPLLNNNRLLRKAREQVKNCLIEPPTHMLATDTMAGGWTGVNPNYIDCVCEGLKTIDATSHYPAMMTKGIFPIETFLPLSTEGLDTLQDLLNLIEKNCVMMEVTLYNLKSKTPHAGYLSEHRHCGLEEMGAGWICNGKVMTCEKMTICCNDIEFKTLLKTYSFHAIEVACIAVAKRGYLPKPLVKLIFEAYADKTILKGIKGQERFYAIAKALLNSLFGICATNVFRDVYPFDSELCAWGETIKFDYSRDDVQKICDNENKRSNRYVYYPWGAYITAAGRAETWEFIMVAGKHFRYADTDSLKYSPCDEIEEFIIKKNAQIKEQIEDTCKRLNIPLEVISPKNLKGESKTLGVWEYEKTSELTKIGGPKRYLEYNNGKFDLTCAGVSPETGGGYFDFLAQGDVMKGFKCFEVDLVIPHKYCRTLIHKLIEEKKTTEVTDHMGNKRIVESQGGTVLIESTYTLNREDRTMQYLDAIVRGGESYELQSYQSF